MLKRIIGVLLVIIAVLSLVFSLVVTYGVWSLRTPVAEAALAGLQLADSTLTTTNDALAAVDDALTQRGQQRGCRSRHLPVVVADDLCDRPYAGGPGWLPGRGAA